jgi:hypothetical protein
VDADRDADADGHADDDRNINRDADADAPGTDSHGDALSNARPATAAKPNGSGSGIEGAVPGRAQSG